MFWTFLLAIFALVVGPSTDVFGQGAVPPPKKCQIKRTIGVFHSSDSHVKVVKSVNSRSESECRRNCCENSSCSLYMYSKSAPTLHKQHHVISCSLIFCANKALCVTKIVSKNATGLSVVGVRQDVIKKTSMVNSSHHLITNKQLKTHPYIANTNISHRRVSTNITTHHISRINGTNARNSNAPDVTTRNPTVRHPTAPQPIADHGTNVTGLASHTKHFHSITSLNRTHFSLLKPRVKSKLDHPVNHSKIHPTTTISHHAFSPLDRNLSAVNLMVKNLSSTFSNVLNTSSSTSYPQPSSSFVNNVPNMNLSISRTTSLTTHTVTVVGSWSNTVLSSAKSESRHRLRNASHTPTTSMKPKNPSKKFSEHHTHTTPASLVISLIIGILFFGTVVFLIGRRWCETCFRRGYSRVDYLLNDYD